MQRFVSGTLVLALIGGLCLHVYALDQLNKKKIGDEEQVRISGTIQSITPDQVSIKDSAGKEHVVPVSQIESVRFEQEPKGMFLARNAALRGAYDEAIRMFDEFKENPADLTLREAKEDVEYYPAYCRAMLALTAGEDTKKPLADLAKFIGDSEHRGSYHMLEANQLLGDLKSALGDYAGAEEAYKRLANSSDLGYKMSGSVALGYALLEQNKVGEAQTTFSSVTGLGDASNPFDLQQQYAAKLGVASCIAKNPNQLNQAIKQIEDVIRQSNEDGPLYGRAFNTLGNCYRGVNRDKEALLAFLKVDVLYPQNPRDHAEALFNLTQLWTKLKELPNAKQRAQDYREKLKSRYPNSPWTKKAMGG